MCTKSENGCYQSSDTRDSNTRHSLRLASNAIFHVPVHVRANDGSWFYEKIFLTSNIYCLNLKRIYLWDFMNYDYRWAGYLTTKIITLSELFSFAKASILVCSTSDQVTAHAFGHIWGKCVSSMKNLFSFNWRSVLYSFLIIFRGYLWLHMRVSWSIPIRSQRIRALLSLPRLALRAEKFQESSLCTLCTVNVGLWNGMAMYVTNTNPIHPPTIIHVVEHALCKIKIRRPYNI
jgi:hypothetical protein